MPDRRSAGIFSWLFKELAKDPSPANLKLARSAWEEIAYYQFSPNNLQANKALLALGLLRLRNPEGSIDNPDNVEYAPVARGPGNQLSPRGER